MGTNSRNGTGSGAEILASKILPGPILGTGCHSGGALEESCDLQPVILMEILYILNEVW